MKRLLLGSLLALAASAARAEAQYGAFEQFADAASLKPFTRDLGGVLGSATFHSGRSLGFSGFDVGARVGGQFYPSKGNKILRNNGVRVFGVPWVQAEIGLPLRIDGFIRGVSYQGLAISGGGMRYSLYAPSDRPWVPLVLVSAVGHSVVHRYFSASHFGANLVSSIGTQTISTYAGVGFDRTRLLVRSSLFDPSLNGTIVQTLESRFTAGVRLRPWQFTYVNLAYTHAHGQPGAEAGLGIRF